MKARGSFFFGDKRLRAARPIFPLMLIAFAIPDTVCFKATAGSSTASTSALDIPPTSISTLPQAGSLNWNDR
jgi:hypothetical protein